MPVLLLCVGLLLAWGAAAAQEGGEGSVSGRLIGNPEKNSLEGATVILLMYKLGEEGKPKGGPVGRVQAGAGGGFTFTGIPVDRQGVYQLGSRVDGSLVTSEYFTFPDGQTTVVHDLTIPELSDDISSLGVGLALFALEPHRGGVAVTEVLHFDNPGHKVMDLSKEPLRLSLPSGAEELNMMKLEFKEPKHEQLGETLLVFGKIPPGRVTMAFRYNLPVWTGAFELSKSYPFAVEHVRVLAPKGSLEIRGAVLTPQESDTLGGVVYDAWEGGKIAAGETLFITAGGLPVKQELLLLPLAGFLLVMAGVVIWFIMGRLGSPARAGSEG